MSVATKTLAAFDDELRAANMSGKWNAEAVLAKLTDGPLPAGTPMVWPYAAIRAKLDEACVLFPESLTARRNITFITPNLPRRGSTPSIIAGMQLVLPGEVAWAHRHSIEALRFVVEGDPQLYTVVDGCRVPMETNDLVLTPRYTWHDHHNESDRVGVWLDVLDVPLVTTLNQVFYDPLGEITQPVDAMKSPAALRFAWTAMRAALDVAAREPADRVRGTRLPYLDAGGRHPLRALGCYAQVLPAGFSGGRSRRTQSALYYAIAGSGRALIGDTELHWSAKDTFVVPSWAPHRLINDSAHEEAVLFTVDDEPLLDALGLLREEFLEA